MAKIQFEQDEYLTMAMFEDKTRTKTMQGMKECLQFIKEDQELTEIVKSTIRKMQGITDEEFKSIDLAPYKQEEGES